MFKLYKKAYESKNHILIGLVILGILYYLNFTYKWMEIPSNSIFLIELIVIGIIYSLIPDIDQPGSIINKYATIVLVGVILFAFYNQEYQKYGILSAIVLGLLRIIEHRTILHSVLGAALISAPLYFILTLFHFLVGFIAFTIHIIADNDFSLGWEKDWRFW